MAAPSMSPPPRTLLQGSSPPLKSHSIPQQRAPPPESESDPRGPVVDDYEMVYIPVSAAESRRIDLQRLCGQYRAIHYVLQTRYNGVDTHPQN